jgi:four helix bundle protein
MNNETFGFEELDVWKKVREFKVEVRTLLRQFPIEERYRLVDQATRSIRSINALIAEGHGRFTYPDQIHYCVQARGSLSETVNHLIDAHDEGYISEEQLFLLKQKAKIIQKLLNGYLVFLRCKRDEKNKIFQSNL